MKESIQLLKQKFVFLAKNDPMFVNAANNFKKDITDLLKQCGAKQIKVKIGRYYIEVIFDYVAEQKITLGDYLLYPGTPAYIMVVATNSAGDVKREKVFMDDEQQVSNNIRRILNWVGEP